MKRNPYVSCSACGAGNKDTRKACFKCGFDLRPTTKPFFGTNKRGWARRRNPYVSCRSCGSGNRDTRDTCFKCGFDLKPTAPPMFGTRSKAWSRTGYISRRNPCGCDDYIRNPGCGCQIDWRQDAYSRNPSGVLNKISTLAKNLQKNLSNTEDSWIGRQLNSIKNLLKNIVHEIRGSEPPVEFKANFTNRANAALISAYADELSAMSGEASQYEDELQRAAHKLSDLQPATTRRNPGMRRWTNRPRTWDNHRKRHWLYRRNG